MKHIHYGNFRVVAALFVFLMAGLLLFPACTQKSDTAGKTYKICLVQYIDSPISEDTKQGVIEGLHNSGLQEGKDYTLKIYNAQGDVSTLNSIMDMVNNEAYTVIIVSSTPTLQAALNKVKNAPIVFTTVADPVAGGAGESFAEHLPNVTGISTLGDYEGLVKILPRILPNARTIGTLFAPGEINSVVNKDHFDRFTRKYNLKLVAVPVNSTADVSNAAQSLAGQNIDALCQIICNLTDAAFPAIAQAAQKKRIPLFGFTDKQIAQGAIAVVSRDYVQAGKDAVMLVLRILKGENPAQIPFALVSKSNLIINKRAARNYGITIPDDLLKQADKVVGE